MSESIDLLQARVNAISNAVVQNAAQALVDLAARNESDFPELVQELQIMFALPATGQGTPIFYSGTGPNGESNHDNAIAVRDQVLSGEGYIWSDTPLGAFVQSSITPGLESFGYLPPGTYFLTVNYLSALMAAEAQGPAVACVAGAAA